MKLWFAIFVGPVTWAADFALSYLLTQRACAAQSSLLLLALSALAFGLTMAGLVVALHASRELPSSKGNGVGTRADPTRFLVLSGIASSAGFLLAIVAAALPRLMMDPCI